MMIHFIRPQWLWLLIPALLYLIGIILFQRQYNPWKKICDPHLLKILLEKNSHTSRIFFNLTLFLLFIISIFALAGPAWKKTKLPIYQDINSTMVILDLSPAMQNTDLKPDRLTRAKLKIRDLIHATKNTQMGLVVFTEEAFVASPLSQDANTLDILLDALNPQMMPVTGGEMGSGLEQGLALLEQANIEHSNLLLITSSEPTAKSWVLAKNIAATGHYLHILGMLEANNSTQTIITKLQQLAALGDGSFYLFTPDGADIKDILHHPSAKQIMQNDAMEKAYLWQDAGPWFCLLLIPLALVILRGHA